MNKSWFKGRWKRLIAILPLPLFAVLLAILTLQKSDNQKVQNPQIEEVNYYKATQIIDGDTLKVKANNDPEQTIRLIGIDTPEIKDPRTMVQCFGAEASQHLKDLLKDKKIRLESDITQDDKDKYNRLLRYIKLEDGTDINIRMLADGYAYEYTYDKPYKYQSDYKKAQQEADAQEKGLWSADTCNGERTKPALTPVPTPALEETPEPTPTPDNCDPNYTPCIPNVSYDLDCGDINFSVRVIGTDRHRFDRDGDGIGCESN